MNQPLPTGDFKWLKKEEIKVFDVNSTETDGDKCYMLEVDLDYPDHIHDKHTDFPLAVEGKSVEKEQLSEFNKNALERNGDRFIRTRKLIPDLKAKHK